MVPAAHLTVRLYTTHRVFARGLRDREGVWPEGTTDDMGNVVGGVLPLGPSLPDLRHRLAHVLTEWLLDRLTGNAADRQPSPAWVYDGLAEWEAARRTTAPPCSVHGAFPVPLTSITSPAGWWRVRGGPLGSLEYCEAQVAVTRLIAQRGGWARVEAHLERRPAWGLFARWLQGKGR